MEFWTFGTHVICLIHPNQYSWILDWMTCFAICFPCFLSYPTEYNSSHRDVSKRESHQFMWLEKKRSKQRLFAQQKNRRITIVLSRWKDAIKESKEKTIHKIRALRLRKFRSLWAPTTKNFQNNTTCFKYNFLEFFELNRINFFWTFGPVCPWEYIIQKAIYRVVHLNLLVF